jgi:uncharacterized protein involved in exopolysaccharide biosynthesis
MDQTDRFYEPERFSLRSAAYVLFRHGRAILLMLVLGLLTVSTYLMLRPTEYSAMTRVLVGIGREKLEDLGMGPGPVGNVVFQERAQNINNEVEILRDPALITRALPEFKQALDAIPPPPPALARTGLRAVVADIKEQAKAAKAWLKQLGDEARDSLVNAGLMQRVDPDVALAVRLYRSLSVTAVKETDVIAVGFTWDNPQFAAAALNVYLGEYQRQHLRVYASKESVAFYQTQLEKAQAELQSVEAAQIAFLHQGGNSNFDLEKTQLLTTLGALREQRAAALLEQQTAQTKLASIERTSQNGSGWVESGDSGDPVTNTPALDQSYMQLLDQRAKLLLRFQPGADQVREIDSQIARLRGQKYQGLREAYRARVTAVADKIAALDRDIAARQSELRTLTDRTAEFDAIQRRRTSATDLVNDARKKLGELQVNSDLNSRAFSSVRVLSEAVPPLLPNSRGTALMLALGAAFGLLAGIAYAVITEFVSRTFRQPGQVMRVLHLPVLASVPEL